MVAGKFSKAIIGASSKLRILKHFVRKVTICCIIESAKLRFALTKEILSGELSSPSRIKVIGQKSSLDSKNAHPSKGSSMSIEPSESTSTSTEPVSKASLTELGTNFSKT